MNRSASVAVLCLTMILSIVSPAVAQEGPTPQTAPGQPLGVHRGLDSSETLTDNWFGFGESLADHGITIGLSLTQVYQINVHGGLAMHKREGRYTGSYDLELTADLEKLVGIPSASVTALAEGSWSDGLSPESIGDVFGVNGDATGDRAIDLTELFWQQAVGEGHLILRAGKIDASRGFEVGGWPVAFDGSAYANDEATQFLNNALINNPTIPFPEYGMGVAVLARPVEWFYVSGAVVDAEARTAETGFNTAFHSPNHAFTLGEAGVIPEVATAWGTLEGAWRVGIWHDGRPKEKWADASSRKRDDMGFYITIDQQVYKENAEADDDQGAAVFARYGYAHDDVNEIDCFWSIGGQYRGLIPARDDDVWGVGFAQGRLVKAAGYDRSHESVVETYYNIRIAPWIHVSPSFQYVWNPGGTDGVSDAVVMGLRCQIAF